MSEVRNVSLAEVLGQSDETAPDNEQLLLRLRNHRFASEKAKVALLLLLSGCLQPQPTGEVTITVEAAIQELRQIQKQEQSKQSGEHIVVMDKQQLAEVFAIARDQLIQAGVISAVFAGQIERLLAVDEIHIIHGNYARFLYGGDSFPTTDQNRGYIEVGDQVIGSYANRIENSAQTQDVALTKQQCQRIAAKLIVMHEYGHAALQTARAIQLENRAKQSRASSYEDVVAVYTSINAQVADHIAVEPELKAVFAANPAEELQTVDERVASGFEVVALKNGLIEMGVTHEQLQLIVQAYLQRRRQEFEEKRLVVSYMLEKGMGLRQCDQAFQELFFSLLRSEPELAEKCRGGFGPQTMGYSFPLEPGELTQLCNNET